MALGFFPSSESALVQWCATFASGITATPTTYGLTAAQATAFTALSNAYATAYAAASNPNTRSKALVAAKNTARDYVKNSARLLASIINGQPTVTDQQKLALGLNVRQQPVPSPLPRKAFVKIMNVNGRTVKVSVSDSATTGKRGLPAGVQGVTVFSLVAEQPSADITEWTFEGNAGRGVMEVAFPASVPAGTTVWLTAFFFNGRKTSGQASDPISAQLGGGMAAMAA